MSTVTTRRCWEIPLKRENSTASPPEALEVQAQPTKIQLSQVCGLTCESTDFLFFLSTPPGLSVVLLPHRYCKSLEPNETSFLHLSHMCWSLHSRSRAFFISPSGSSLSPPSSPSLCGCWKLFKDARGLNHFDNITWACLTQTNPKPIEKLTVRLCHSSFMKRREAPTVQWHDPTVCRLQQAQLGSSMHSYCIFNSCKVYKY